MARALTAPKFPEDFQILSTEGATYWHWHPDTPADYHGTWPADEEAPPWSGGLWILSEDSVSADLEQATRDGEDMIVTWEFGPELESGPSEEAYPNQVSIQYVLERVIAEVNRQASFA